MCVYAGGTNNLYSETLVILHGDPGTHPGLFLLDISPWKFSPP